MDLSNNCEAAAGCRVLLGNSNENGTNVNDNYHSDNANNNVGLLAVWNFCLLFSVRHYAPKRRNFASFREIRNFKC